MNGKKKLAGFLCLALCLMSLAGCGKNSQENFSSGSEGLGQQVKNQVMDKIAEKIQEKQQELTEADSQEQNPDRQTLETLAGLIGKSDTRLQTEMGGAGENIQQSGTGEIQSRDYTISLFDYQLTDTVALQNGQVVSSYLYLGGEEYEVWQDLMSSCLGRPVQEDQDDVNEISQSVYPLGDSWVTLNSSYGMQYITISQEAPEVHSEKQSEDLSDA